MKSMKNARMWFFRVYTVEDEEFSKLIGKRVRYLIIDDCIVSSPEDLKNITWENVITIPYVFTEDVLKEIMQKYNQK